MSRHTKHNPDYEIAYGLDHVLGYFVQVFERNSQDDEQPILDLDESRNGLTPERIVSIADDYGIKVELHEFLEDK